MYVHTCIMVHVRRREGVIKLDFFMSYLSGLLATLTYEMVKAMARKLRERRADATRQGKHARRP